MTQPEPWRRTGRKAKEDHWLGLEAGAVVEVSLYDDGGQQQGRGVIQLTARAIEDKDTEEGQTWRGQFLAIEDGYYEWWVEKTYKMKILPFHFCARQSQRADPHRRFPRHPRGWFLEAVVDDGREKD